MKFNRYNEFWSIYLEKNMFKLQYISYNGAQAEIAEKGMSASIIVDFIYKHFLCHYIYLSFCIKLKV